jgi:hypothetical protein
MRVLLICFGLFLLSLLPPLLQASDWSGTITYEQLMIGPTHVAPAEKDELEAYAKQIEERIVALKKQSVGAPALVQKTLRADISVLEAERERVVVGLGDKLVVAATTFVLDRNRIATISDNLPRVVVDRERQQAFVMGAEKPELVTLAPIPQPITIDPNAVEVPMLGLATKRIELRAENRKFTVLVARELPNAFALSLVQEFASAEEPDSIWAQIARLPGLPMLIESTNGQVTQRWIVTTIREKVVDVGAFR